MQGSLSSVRRPSPEGGAVSLPANLWDNGAQAPSVWPSTARLVFVRAAFWIPLALCLAVAWTPYPRWELVSSLSGTFAHVAAFAYLAVALFPAHYAATTSQRSSAGRGTTTTDRVLAVGLWLLALGAVIELVQFLLVVGRRGDLQDLAADAAGVALGCAIYLGYLGWMRSPSQTAASPTLDTVE